LTVGFAIADEVAKSADEPDRDKRQPYTAPKQDTKTTNKSKDERIDGRPFIVLMVAIGSVVYPLLVLAIIGFAGIQIAIARNTTGFLFSGIGAIIATGPYAFGILLLNTIEELRLFMLAISPGFGWAVLFIGSFLLIIAGLIRKRAA